MEMVNREEFRDFLYGTFYESVSEPAIIRKQHEKLRTWVQTNIPSKLYRYRNVTVHTLDAFKKMKYGAVLFMHSTIRLNVCRIVS